MTSRIEVSKKQNKMKINILSILCVVFYLCEFVSSRGNSNSIQCKDESGRIVDWYVLYKLPKISESSNPLIRKGVSYLYMTNYTVADGWKLSSSSVESLSSIPGQTLAPLYKDNIAENSAWIMYNDQPPNNRSVSNKYGHTKGIVMAEKTRGFWLIHSVPNFPPLSNSGITKKCKRLSTEECQDNTNYISDGQYSYPDSGKHYGQSFLCISVGADQMSSIAQQLIYNQIISYKYNVPRDMPEYSIFVNASQHPRIEDPPYFHKETIRSIGGRDFIAFSKTDKFQKDLYDDLVAPQLNSNLLAETWLNGRGKLPSECNGTRVLNVQSVALSVANVEFKSSRDHSKWAVAMDKKKNKNWICIGDINRADTQFNRGGGTVCTNSAELWKNYRDAVNDVEPCPRKQGMIARLKTWFKSKFS